MFQHVITLVAFIFAIALTHVLTSASELVLARERVRFSWLHALWMLVAVLGLIINWLSLAGFEQIRHWSVGEVLVQLSWVFPQYFTCSLTAMKVPESGEIDMGAYFERQRPAIFCAYTVVLVVTLIANFLDRDNIRGWGPGDWIGANLLVLPMLLAVIVAWRARSLWMQWSGVGAMLALQCWFLVTYAAYSFAT